MLEVTGKTGVPSLKGIPATLFDMAKDKRIVPFAQDVLVRMTEVKASAELENQIIAAQEKVDAAFKAAENTFSTIWNMLSEKQQAESNKSTILDSMVMGNKAWQSASTDLQDLIDQKTSMTSKQSLAVFYAVSKAHGIEFSVAWDTGGATATNTDKIMVKVHEFAGKVVRCTYASKNCLYMSDSLTDRVHVFNGITNKYQFTVGVPMPDSASAVQKLHYRLWAPKAAAAIDTDTGPARAWHISQTGWDKLTDVNAGGSGGKGGKYTSYVEPEITPDMLAIPALLTRGQPDPVPAETSAK